MVWRAEVFLILAAGIFCAGSVLVWRGTGGGFGGPDVKLAKVFEANFSVGAHRRHGARYLSQYGVRGTFVSRVEQDCLPLQRMVLSSPASFSDG